MLKKAYPDVCRPRIWDGARGLAPPPNQGLPLDLTWPSWPTLPAWRQLLLGLLRLDVRLSHSHNARFCAAVISHLKDSDEPWSVLLCFHASEPLPHAPAGGDERDGQPDKHGETPLGQLRYGHPQTDQIRAADATVTAWRHRRAVSDPMTQHRPQVESSRAMRPAGEGTTIRLHISTSREPDLLLIIVSNNRAQQTTLARHIETRAK